MNIQSYIDGVLSGDRRVLARTITLIESSLPDHRQMAAGIIEGLLPHTGKAVRLGITGVPGVGKSTAGELMETIRNAINQNLTQE